MRKASEKDRAFEAKNDSSEREEPAFATSCPFCYAIGPRSRVRLLWAESAIWRRG